MLLSLNRNHSPSYFALSGTQNGDSFHAIVQEAKFRGLNVFDGLSARCSPAHVPESPAPNAQAAAASVSICIADAPSSSSLMSAAAEGVALLLQKAPGRTVVSVSSSKPSNSSDTVHWHLTLDDSSVAALVMQFSSANCTFSSRVAPLDWAANSVASQSFIDSAIVIDAVVRCGLLSQDCGTAVQLSTLHTPAKLRSYGDESTGVGQLYKMMRTKQTLKYVQDMRADLGKLQRARYAMLISQRLLLTFCAGIA